MARTSSQWLAGVGAAALCVVATHVAVASDEVSWEAMGWGVVPGLVLVAVTLSRPAGRPYAWAVTMGTVAGPAVYVAGALLLYLAIVGGPT